MTRPGECPAGGRRCPPSICDCFIELYPDDPLGLHPEAFEVIWPGENVSDPPDPPAHDPV
jgi:hypothetical protein